MLAFDPVIKYFNFFETVQPLQRALQTRQWIILSTLCLVSTLQATFRLLRTPEKQADPVISIR